MILNNTRLLVSKFDDTFLFYRDVLQLKVTCGGLGENYAQFQTGNSGVLALFLKTLMSQTLATGHLPARSMSQDNMVLVFTTDNVDEVYRTLTKRGVKFISVPKDQPDWGIRVVHLRDPEGNVIEFSSDLSVEKYSDGLKQDIHAQNIIRDQHE